MPFVVATFYHFFDFADFREARAPLLAEMKRLGIKGSLLIAAEGVNSTLSGERDAIGAFLAFLKKQTGEDFLHKESPCERQPFGRAKVRLKKEVISLGTHASPVPRTGRYVEAKEWNRLIADPDVYILDARNSYETHLGTFERAVDPRIRNFKQLPAFIKKNLDPGTHKKIATFCTGGIRCEKFSAWLLDQGFAEVYQLKGGILKYLEEVPESESTWRGECYVFDERVAVGHGLTPSQTAGMCPACGHSLTTEDRKHALYIKDERCGFCAG